jgi:hypothetical protein
MEPSDEKIQEIKALLEKQHGREFSWEEATKAAWDIQSLARILLDAAIEEAKRKKMLEEFPKGFHLDRRGTCLICGESTSNEKSWYDKYGLKCMTCQKAINEKIIPATIAKSKESWYSKYDLASYFNIKGALLTKYIKQAVLKDRIIPGEKKKMHLQLFLIRDNKDVLPPKKLLKSRITKIIKDGEEYFTQEHWYEFFDHKSLNRLKKYKIMHYLEESFAQPIQSGRLLFKEINPLFSYNGK